MLQSRLLVTVWLGCTTAAPHPLLTGEPMGAGELFATHRPADNSASPSGDFASVASPAPHSTQHPLPSSQQSGHGTGCCQGGLIMEMVCILYTVTYVGSWTWPVILQPAWACCEVLVDIGVRSRKESFQRGDLAEWGELQPGACSPCQPQPVQVRR